MQNFVELPKPGEPTSLLSFNWDYTPGPQYNTPETSPQNIWESLGANLESAGDYVWNGAKGAWESSKESLAGAYNSVKSEIKEVGSSAFSGVGSLMDYVQDKIIILAVVLIAIIWVLGKSGAFSALVAVFKI